MANLEVKDIFALARTSGWLVAWTGSSGAEKFLGQRLNQVPSEKLEVPKDIEAVLVLSTVGTCAQCQELVQSLRAGGDGGAAIIGILTDAGAPPCARRCAPATGNEKHRCAIPAAWPPLCASVAILAQVVEWHVLVMPRTLLKLVTQSLHLRFTCHIARAEAACPPRHHVPRSCDAPDAEPRRAERPGRRAFLASIDLRVRLSECFWCAALWTVCVVWTATLGADVTGVSATTAM